MLTQEEIALIHEEEKVRAEARRLYDVQEDEEEDEEIVEKPKKKTSKITWIILIAIILGVYISGLSSSSSSTPTVSPIDLPLKTSSSLAGLTIYNNSSSTIDSCNVKLNDNYKIYVKLDPGENYFSWERITTDKGERFDFSSIKPKSIFISCENPEGYYSGNW